MAVKILYVEDEVTAAYPVKKLLIDEGYEVVHVFTGEEALRAATRNSFDLVLVDMDLGAGLDGAELAAQLLQTHDWPVVFLSAHTERAFVDRVKKISNYGYVIKNSGEFVLLETLEAALRLQSERKANLALVARLRFARNERELVLNSLPDGVISFSADHQLSFKSETYRRQMGIAKDDATVETVEEVTRLVHPDDRGVLNDIFAAISEKKTGLEYRFRVRHVLGHYFWRQDRARFTYDDQGNYLGAFVLCRDISESVSDHAEIVEGAARLRVMMDIAGIAWWEFNDKTGRVSFDEHMTKMLGYEAADFVHYRDLTKRVHPDDVELAMAAMRSFLSGAKPRYDVTYRVLAKSGDYLWFRDVGRLKEADPVTGERLFAGILIDVSEQKATEAATLEAQRYVVIREITAAIAHDFNNMLQAIVGNAELALLLPSDEPKLVKYLSAVRSLAFDASQRVRPLGQMARGQSKNDDQGPIDLNALIREAVEQTQPLWRALARSGAPESALTVHLKARGTIEGNRGDLRNVLLNLIKNAVEAMPNGGHLSFETADTDTAVSFKRTDTGMGMDETTRAKVFQPFFSTKGSGQGRGLGMGSIAATVKEHRGTVEVIETSSGVGTTIELRFPFSRGLAETSTQTSTDGKVASLRILWVDDDEAVRRTGSEMIRALGHSIDVAEDGTAALELVHSHRYDLVITDLGMKGLDGWQFAEKAREAGVACKIVLLTAWGEYVTEQQVETFELFEVLSKPIGLEQLKGLASRASHA